MPLIPPPLAGRSFDEVMEETLARIPVPTPEWSDHQAGRPAASGAVAHGLPLRLAVMVGSGFIVGVVVWALRRRREARSEECGSPASSDTAGASAEA